MNDDALRDHMVGVFLDHQWHLKESRDFYTGARRPGAIGVSVPPQMRQLLASIGYPKLYVDALAERLNVQGFRLGGDESDDVLWHWWCSNGLKVSSVLGHTEAMVTGCAYATVSVPNPDNPRLDPKVPMIRVEPPTALHAVIDPYTLEVSRAVRVIEDKNLQNRWVTVYLPDRTITWAQEDNKQWATRSIVRHDLGFVPVVPLCNQTVLGDINGVSEITLPLRTLTDFASRVMMCMGAATEMMAIPQRVLFGVSADDIGAQQAPLGDGKGHYDAYTARILAIEDVDAKATQFSAAELRNFVDVLREVAKQVAAVTGLPPQYLSSSNDNPASAEAIRAAEERMLTNINSKQQLFGAAWVQVMQTAWQVMNPGEQLPEEYYRLECAWAEAATPTYASRADAAVKLYANGTGIIPKRQARLDMNYSLSQIDQMDSWDEEDDPFRGMAPQLVSQPPDNLTA